MAAASDRESPCSESQRIDGVPTVSFLDECVYGEALTKGHDTKTCTSCTRDNYQSPSVIPSSSISPTQFAGPETIAHERLKSTQRTASEGPWVEVGTWGLSLVQALKRSPVRENGPCEIDPVGLLGTLRSEGMGPSENRTTIVQYLQAFKIFVSDHGKFCCTHRVFCVNRRPGRRVIFCPYYQLGSLRLVSAVVLARKHLVSN